MRPADRVMQSYGRCCASPEFFDTFYRLFTASSPRVREKFLNTDMLAQKQLLRAGILTLVLHARGMPDSKLRAIGQSHSREGFDIRPELYDLWLDCLLQAVRVHDREAGESDLAAWREVLGPGIALIKSFY